MTTMNNEDTADQSVHEQRELPEPAAWRVRGYAQFKTGKPGPWRFVDSAMRPTVQTPEDCDFDALYTADQMRAAVDAEREANAHELSAALGWPGGISEPVTDVAQLLRRVAGARRILSKLSAELVAIAETSALPDGDGVNAPTLLWAEEWRSRLAEKEQPK